MTWGWTDFFFGRGAGGPFPNQWEMLKKKKSRADISFLGPNPPVRISHYILYYQLHSYPTVLKWASNLRGEIRSGAGGDPGESSTRGINRR